jgi:RimJ/RimL family protein N-acetyltransferase
LRLDDKVKLTDWDSSVFKAPAGELRIEALHSSNVNNLGTFMREVKAEGIVFLSARLPLSQTELIHQLEDVDFKFIETTIEPQLDLNSVKNEESTSFDVIEPKGKVLADHLRLASNISFTAGRLQVDSRIPNNMGDKRYKNWFSQALDQNGPRLASVVERNYQSTPAAFFLWEIAQNHTVSWLLNGMATGHRGKGLAGEVWTAMIAHHRQDSQEFMTKIRTRISLTNLPALRLYTKLGFALVSPMVTLHWLNPDYDFAERRCRRIRE